MPYSIMHKMELEFGKNVPPRVTSSLLECPEGRYATKEQADAALPEAHRLVAYASNAKHHIRNGNQSYLAALSVLPTARRRAATSKRPSNPLTTAEWAAIHEKAMNV